MLINISWRAVPITAKSVLETEQGITIAVVLDMGGGKYPVYINKKNDFGGTKLHQIGQADGYASGQELAEQFLGIKVAA